MTTKKPPSNVINLDMPATKGDVSNAITHIKAHITTLFLGMVIGVFIMVVIDYKENMAIVKQELEATQFIKQINESKENESRRD